MSEKSKNTSILKCDIVITNTNIVSSTISKLCERLESASREAEESLGIQSTDVLDRITVYFSTIVNEIKLKYYESVRHYKIRESELRIFSQQKEKEFEKIRDELLSSIESLKSDKLCLKDEVNSLKDEIYRRNSEISQQRQVIEDLSKSKAELESQLSLFKNKEKRMASNGVKSVCRSTDINSIPSPIYLETNDYSRSKHLRAYKDELLTETSELRPYRNSKPYLKSYESVNKSKDELNNSRSINNFFNIHVNDLKTEICIDSQSKHKKLNNSITKVTRDQMNKKKEAIRTEVEGNKPRNKSSNTILENYNSSKSKNGVSFHSSISKTKQTLLRDFNTKVGATEKGVIDQEFKIGSDNVSGKQKTRNNNSIEVGFDQKKFYSFADLSKLGVAHSTNNGLMKNVFCVSTNSSVSLLRANNIYPLNSIASTSNPTNSFCKPKTNHKNSIASCSSLNTPLNNRQETSTPKDKEKQFGNKNSNDLQLSTKDLNIKYFSKAQTTATSGATKTTINLSNILKGGMASVNSNKSQSKDSLCISNLEREFNDKDKVTINVEELNMIEENPNEVRLDTENKDELHDKVMLLPSHDAKVQGGGGSINLSTSQLLDKIKINYGNINSRKNWSDKIYNVSSNPNLCDKNEVKKNQTGPKSNVTTIKSKLNQQFHFLNK